MIRSIFFKTITKQQRFLSAKQKLKVVVYKVLKIIEKDDCFDDNELRITTGRSINGQLFQIVGVILVLSSRKKCTSEMDSKVEVMTSAIV